MAPLKVVVVGGGAGGLVTLKYLATAHEYYPSLDPIDVQLFEAEEEIGGVFNYRVWNDAEMVSSKYLTAFSDFRIRKDMPDFIPTSEYLRYLKSYAEYFDLNRYIHCGMKVSQVKRSTKKDGAACHHVRVEPVESKALDPVTMVQNFISSGHDAMDLEVDAVVVCSGLHQTPSIPKIPGLLPELTTSKFTDSEKDGKLQTMTVMHATQFKNRPGADSEFNKSATRPDGSTVVVLGAGETGHDIAYCAVRSPYVKRVVMCHRDGFFIAPKIVPWPIVFGFWGRPTPGMRPNKPIDTSIASLFDTMYVPPVIQRGQMLWEVYDKWIKGIFAMICGSSKGIDQWAGGISSERYHLDAIFAVKTMRAIPFISAPFRGGSKWMRPFYAIRKFFINIPIQDTGDRVIELAPWPTSFGPETVDGKEVPNAMYFAEEDLQGTEGEMMKKHIQEKGPATPDVVILATGFRREIPFLDDSYPTVDDVRHRFIYDDIEDGFAYIGFVRPSIGAIPPLAELQAQLWVSKFIEAKVPSARTPPSDTADQQVTKPTRAPDSASIPGYELDYALHSRGGYNFFTWKHGVDQESYAFQLALDMGAAPKASHVWHNFDWRVFYTWAMGPNFNTKFRLVGPWARPKEAAEVMSGELFDVVKRSGGGFFFFTYTVIPFFFFGFLSMSVMGCEWLINLFR